MSTTLDSETAQQLTDAEQVALMIKSPGWGVVHGKLVEKVLDLQNINNIDATDPSTLSTQLLGRKMASDLLYAWLNGDVFGLVEQVEANKLRDLQTTEDFVTRG